MDSTDFSALRSRST